MAKAACAAGVAVTAASLDLDVAGRASLGDDLAAGLCSAVAAAVSPKEDVQGYLDAALLPVLGPAMERLLRHVHETGELRRALKERRDAEKRAQEAENKPPEYESPRALRERRGSNASIGAAARVLRERRGSNGASPRSQSGSPDAASVGKGSSKEEADGVDDFDPLLWLAEALQESAALPSGRYREKVEAIVQAELDAAAAAAAAAAAVTAAENEEGEPSGTEDVAPSPARGSPAPTPTRASVAGTPKAGGAPRAGTIGGTAARNGSVDGRTGR